MTAIKPNLFTGQAIFTQEELFSMRTLPPMHTSAETAYLVDDYPYGFTLRCRMYVWLEYRPKFGYRMVTQTTNPRRTGHVLNKPKAGIYHPLAVLFLDDNE